MDDLYREEILDELDNLQHQGELPEADVEQWENNASCGDEITVRIKFASDKKNPQITDLKWQGKGCAISQVTMSLLSDKILREKLTQQEIKDLTQKDMENLLGLDEVSPGRIKCLMLGLKAIKKANSK